MSSEYEKDLEAQNEVLLKRTAELEQMIFDFHQTVEDKQEFVLEVVQKDWDLIKSQAQVIYMQKKLLHEMGVEEEDIEMDRYAEASGKSRTYLKNYVEKLFSNEISEGLDTYVHDLFKKHLLNRMDMPEV
jgi:hypothetical protein